MHSMHSHRVIAGGGGRTTLLCTSRLSLAVLSLRQRRNAPGISHQLKVFNRERGPNVPVHVHRANRMRVGGPSDYVTGNSPGALESCLAVDATRGCFGRRWCIVCSRRVYCRVEVGRSGNQRARVRSDESLRCREEKREPLRRRVCTRVYAFASGQRDLSPRSSTPDGPEEEGERPAFQTG